MLDMDDMDWGTVEEGRKQVGGMRKRERVCERERE